MKPTSVPVMVCAVLLGLASCDTTRDVLDRSQEFADKHNFYQAYWVVAEALDENRDDPELERVFWQRRLDYLLDRGQDLVFNERELEAIAEFRKALALDSENERAKAWIVRAKQKLANEALRQADTLRYEGDLPGALKLYNKASSYVAELPAAKEGIAKVNEEYEKRSEESVEHYVLGARARGEQKYQQSHYHGKVATGLDESNNRAKILVNDAGKRLARSLLDQATETESRGFYAAALQEYRRVKAQLPNTPGIDDRIQAMENEVKVRQLCREAEMLARKKRFDEADKLLAEAFALSRYEKATVSGLMLEAKSQRYEDAYRNAKDLEIEFQYEAALEAFKAIDKAFPNRGFRDVKTRISGLKSNIDVATKSYEKGQAAEKAGKLKDAINFYEEAILAYPGFKKLRTKIDELKGKTGS